VTLVAFPLPGDRLGHAVANLNATMKSEFSCFTLAVALSITGCVSTNRPPETGQHRAATLLLKEAGSASASAEERAVLYLRAARGAGESLGSAGATDESARQIYNKAAADLTLLLRTADNGRMWNRPQTFTAAGTSYRLRFAGATRDGIWDPAYFTSFTPSAEVDLKTIKRRNHQDGIGGALVGVHTSAPLEPFSPRVGVASPVTAVLDFKGSDVTLSLIDPAEKAKVRAMGVERVPDADFSAPLAYYPQKSEFWEGLMGAIRVSDYMNTTGLYMLQPYDPDRIPLIFVHGLISTPRMWRNVINELETDPVLRGRYQCWVFGYPTGNPPAYSAYRFRQELAKVHELYPKSRNYVLVGHSMGGLVSRMQCTTLTRESWDVIGKDKAENFFAKVKKGDLVDQCMVFNANPSVDRVIFICTPHRGSEMAVGTLGDLAIRLISLPVDLTATVTKTVGSSLGAITGTSGGMPNSVTGLSPKNPTLKVLDATPIQAHYHTILGDEGKGNSPKSTDGVVPYWSSHLSKAKSERIVPGPHGSCELPATLDELRRILHLHLKEQGGKGATR
jgi:hypothetical protein